MFQSGAPWVERRRHAADHGHAGTSTARA
jgi:hypothetical protein